MANNLTLKTELWMGEDRSTRLHRCLIFLAQEGMVTEYEDKRIFKRIMREWDRTEESLARMCAAESFDG